MCMYMCQAWCWWLLKERGGAVKIPKYQSILFEIVEEPGSVSVYLCLLPTATLNNTRFLVLFSYSCMFAQGCSLCLESSLWLLCLLRLHPLFWAVLLLLLHSLSLLLAHWPGCHCIVLLSAVCLSPRSMSSWGQGLDQFLFFCL